MVGTATGNRKVALELRQDLEAVAYVAPFVAPNTVAGAVEIAVVAGVVVEYYFVMCWLAGCMLETAAAIA